MATFKDYRRKEILACFRHPPATATNLPFGGFFFLPALIMDFLLVDSKCSQSSVISIVYVSQSTLSFIAHPSPPPIPSVHLLNGMVGVCLSRKLDRCIVVRFNRCVVFACVLCSSDKAFLYCSAKKLGLSTVDFGLNDVGSA